MKFCNGCNSQKEDDCFSKNQSICKTCNKQYYEDNKEIISKSRKQYYIENAEEIKESHKQYLENQSELEKQQRAEYFRAYQLSHPNEIKANNSKYTKSNKAKITRKNLRKNPTIRLRQNISTNIGYHLKLQNSSKYNKSILKFLPYTMKELKIYLEKLFESWMTWENYGQYDPKTWDDNDPATWTWNLDHIIPHSTFEYTIMEDRSFQECWALSNLRPYSAKQNCLDGIRRTRHGKSDV